jgi:uncharacterized protein YggE
MRTRIPVIALISAILAVPPILVAPAALAAGDNLGPRTISVSGQGDVRAAPDEATLSAGVVTQATTAADALSANTRAMNRVFATLKGLGIPDKAMQTNEFSVSPQYSNDRNGNSQKIIGYQVTNNVSVTVDDLRNLGPALDALVSAGANALGSIQFTIRDPKPLENDARAAAMHDAMDKADAYAKAAGLRLGPILSISEGSEAPQPMFRAKGKAMMTEAAPVAAGEKTVTASVSVTFGIE